MSETGITILMAGGGTGGHLFPLVAVAEELTAQVDSAKIVFAGTKDRLEATVIPTLGYKFFPVVVEGFNKKGGMKRLPIVLVKLMIGFFQSVGIIVKQKPIVVIASGAYVSAPVVLAAKFLGLKIVLLEQNSFPGLTIRLLERFADQLHLSFSEAGRFLKHPEKHILSGNPIRTGRVSISRERARQLFSLTGETTVLFLGGSLGAGTLNEAIQLLLPSLNPQINVIWQTGKNYHRLYAHNNSEKIKIFAFIDDMPAAYSAADIIVTRAGATTMAELAMTGKPVILIPSPNVADNHQLKNAQSFAEQGAAILIEEKEIKERLSTAVTLLADNPEQRKYMGERIAQMAKPQAAKIIVESVLRLIQQ